MLLVYLLGIAGLTIVITMGKITAPIRNFFPPPIGSKGQSKQCLCDTSIEASKRPAMLLCCAMCSGTWVGGFFGTLFITRDTLPPLARIIVDGIMFAFAGSAASYAFFAWLCHVKAP